MLNDDKAKKEWPREDMLVQVRQAVSTPKINVPPRKFQKIMYMLSDEQIMKGE